MLISVITPSFQQDRFIERTIKSVLNQAPVDFEYFIYDALSTDKTTSILTKYKHCISWFSEPDNGQAHAVNKGLAKSTGDIIAWINSDDIYYPGAFRQVLSFFEHNPNVSGLYGQADWLDEDDNVIATYPTQAWDYKQLTRECYLCQPAVFFRRSLVDRLGDLDVGLKYCMDYELWLRYGRTNPFVYLPIKLAGSRIYPENKTFSNQLTAHHETNGMLLEKIGYSTRHWIFKYSKLQVEGDTQIDKSDLKFTLKFIEVAIEKSCKFNKKAVLIVLLKVIFYDLKRRMEWMRSHSDFDVENTILEQRDRL